jgi:hypothetical protein
MLNEYGEYHYAVCYEYSVNAECHYAECHYTECHGAHFLPPTLFLPHLCSSSFSPDF